MESKDNEIGVQVFNKEELEELKKILIFVIMVGEVF